jgi:hypothetical protein
MAATKIIRSTPRREPRQLRLRLWQQDIFAPWYFSKWHKINEESVCAT